VFLSTGLEPTMLGANCDATHCGNLTGYFTPEPTEPAGKGYKRGDDQSERNQIARRITFGYIGNNKSGVPVVVLARWGRITGLYRPWNQGGVRSRHRGSGGLDGPRVTLQLLHCGHAAIAGGVIVRRRKRVHLFPLLVPAVIVLFAVALSWGSNRYRASAEGALVVLAAVAIDAGARVAARPPGPVCRRRLRRRR
jgi:hypothetical protein